MSEETHTDEWSFCEIVKVQNGWFVRSTTPHRDLMCDPLGNSHVFNDWGSLLAFITHKLHSESE
jgi:hypothetical protein